MAIKMDDHRSSSACFFDEGLRFECQRCGQCCTGAPGSIYISPDEINCIASYLKIETRPFLEQYTYPFKDSRSIREDSSGRCLFFDEGCRIYAVRPLQCRSFPFWFGNIRNRQRWQAVSRECPGIGVGPLFDRERILEIAFATRHI